MANLGGRRSQLMDTALVERILNSIRAGTPFLVACNAVGITERVFYKWRKVGREASKKESKLTKFEKLCVQFVQDVKKAECESIDDGVKLIRIHSKTSWQAAAWLLERRHPEQFGRRDNLVDMLRFADDMVKKTLEFVPPERRAEFIKAAEREVRTASKAV